MEIVNDCFVFVKHTDKEVVKRSWRVLLNVNIKFMFIWLSFSVCYTACML